MKRREFIRLVGGAVACPLTASAQQQGRIVTIGVLGDSLHRLPRVMSKHLVQEVAHAKDFFRLQLNVTGLTSGATVGLVNQNAGVGKSLELLATPSALA